MLYVLLPDVPYLLDVCRILMWILIASYCIREASGERPRAALVFMRKMSIIIYFTHFFFATAARALHERGFIDFEHGMPVFFCAIICCSLFAFVIVKASEKYKILRYMY